MDVWLHSPARLELALLLHSSSVLGQDDTWSEQKVSQGASHACEQFRLHTLISRAKE